MRTEEQLKKRLADYKGAEYFFTPHGYVAWQVSTGENVEILFIEVAERRKGHGTELMREFAKRIDPYHSVFVFRLATNHDAGQFYRKLGFSETVIPGLYDGVDAVLGVINYDDLCQNLLTR